ncbi:MAG: sugar phosphate isomerase/epimerase [Verrucomicrobiales bacterium]|nr:sugar phosphate isomerase/epimerase [Verrucomicrobiales bacterium]
MTPNPLTGLSRLCIHTITTKPWSIEEAMDKYAQIGVGGITVWRQWLDGHNISIVGDQIRERNLEIVSLCRGGFFPAPSPAERKTAIEDNRLAIHEAAQLGAPTIVLVCGAVPGQPLEESRKQIADGIEAVLPLAEEHDIQLAIEPLHPMYADDRSAINSMASANAVCDHIDHPLVGIAADVYHIWWDPDLEAQITEAGEKDRLFAFHICDWMTPTTDLLNDRGLMGEGCIDIPGIRAMVEAAGFDGYNEVEIFSDRWWKSDPDEFLLAIREAYLTHS